MDETQRQHAATATVGYGLTAAGGIVRGKGLKEIDHHLGPRQRRHPEVLRLARTRKLPALGRARALWGAGTALGTVGATAATAGTLGVLHEKVKKLAPPDPIGFVATGVKGTVDANRKVYETHPAYHEKHRGLRRALVIGGVAGGGAIAGQISRRVAPRLVKQSHLPAVHAVAGVAGGALALPPASRMASHITRRKRRTNVRPSSAASTVEARSSHGATPESARRQIVPIRKDDGLDGSDLHVPGTLVSTNRWKKPRMKKMTPYEASQKVEKLFGRHKSGMTPAEQRAQLQRRKRQFATNVAATATGTSGLGLLAAGAKHSPLPRNLADKAARAAPKAAILGGGVGAVSAIQALRIQHKDLKVQSDVLKALVPTTPAVTTTPGAARTPAYRSSFLRTSRTSTGATKIARVSAGIVR